MFYDEQFIRQRKLSIVLAVPPSPDALKEQDKLQALLPWQKQC
jgi:hypothetical protein